MSISKVLPSAESSARYVTESGASPGLDNSVVFVTFANPRKAPLPSKVIVPAAASYVYVASIDESCGYTGTPHDSGSVPCHDSSHVSAPNTLSKVPSALNTYSSSNKQALVATSAELFDHQPTLF